MPTTNTTNWIEQNVHATKRKRAGLVCVGCHERKIKCDLQALSESGKTSCTRCTTSNIECRLRPSKRGNQQNAASGRPSSSQQTARTGSPNHQMNELENALCTPPYSTATNDMIALHNQQAEANFIDPAVDQFSEFAGSHNYLYPHLPIVPGIQAIVPHHDMAVSHRATVTDQAVVTTQSKPNSEPYLGESGFLSVYSQEVRDYHRQNTTLTQERQASELPGSDLLGIFTETYFNSCYAFCPVLDRGTIALEIEQSQLVATSIALTGSHIQPPILPSIKPETYYSRAKQMFHDEVEPDPMRSLQAVCLFYWWSPRPSQHSQRDQAWWWSAVGIRMAQQIGFHREAKGNVPSRAIMDRGLRRRIWWTLFARERLTAICQGRPCLIDPTDCNIPEPSLDDFPNPNDPKAETFIHWIRVCGVIGRIAKYRSRAADAVSLAFPTELAEEMIQWVQGLPQHLSLPVASKYTMTFDRDVHQLHLPYLATIIILHLSPSSEPLPRAYVAAVMAASCIARIFKDYLSRGGVRFLMPISGWICGVATLALLRASRHAQLRQHAEEDIKILVIALTELKVSYPVADMFLQGFERLRAYEKSSNPDSNNSEDDDFYTNSRNATTGDGDGVDWARYFPFMTAQTSGLAGVLMAEHISTPLLDQAWFASMPMELQDVFGPFGSFPEYV